LNFKSWSRADDSDAGLFHLIRMMIESECIWDAFNGGEDTDDPEDDDDWEEIELILSCERKNVRADEFVVLLTRVRCIEDENGA
jgi:hypothetical protein